MYNTTERKTNRWKKTDENTISCAEVTNPVTVAIMLNTRYISVFAQNNQLLIDEQPGGMRLNIFTKAPYLNTICSIQ